MYRANFAEDREIQEPSVVREILSEQPLDADVVWARAQLPAAKQALREQTERAVQLEIFGAPTWVVDGELFWGQDRIDFVRAKLTQ